MQFNFSTELAKAEEVDGKFYLSGVASTTDKDLQDDIMSASAIEQMAKSAVGLPVTTSHNAEFTDEIGTIVAAESIDGKLLIKAELDSEDAAAMKVYKRIASGRKVGFSVGGKIKSVLPALGKSARRVIDAVALDHVMVTSKPVNKKTFALALAKALEAVPTEDETMTLEDMLKSAELQAHVADEIAKATSAATASLTEELAKAGAKFSADTVSALAAIHAAGNDDVKGKVRAMLGDDADAALGAMPEPANDVVNDGSVMSEEGIGVEKSLAESLADFKKSLVEELKPLIVELAKVEPKGAIVEAPLEKATLDDNRLGEMLRKAFGG